tara:strand:- start:1450 stop:2034 length:585 start_codon:yes stop_codon:yes gene_type:complete
MVYKLPKEAIGDNVLDAGSLTTNLTNSFVPVGGIIMWSGTVAAAEALTNWAICDGDNGTPDLRDRFVLGVGSSSNPSTANKGDDAGSNSIQLTEGQMPQHNHDFNDPGHGHGITDNGHFHTTLDGVGRANYAEPRNVGVGSDGNVNNTGNTDTKTTGITINGNTTGITIQPKGNGDSIDIRSKYLALCYIMRIT